MEAEWGEKGHCKELWENCRIIVMVHATLINPKETTLLDSWPTFSLYIVQLGPKALQLQEAALNVTSELKDETKAVAVVIQFVLSSLCLRLKTSTTSTTVRRIIPHHHRKVAVKSTKAPSKYCGKSAGKCRKLRTSTPLWDTDACPRPVPSGRKQKCKAKVKEKSSSVTCHRHLSLQ